MGSPNTFTITVTSFQYPWNAQARLDAELRPTGWILDDLDYYDAQHLLHLFGEHKWDIILHKADGSGDAVDATAAAFYAWNRVLNNWDGGAVESIIGETGIGAVKTGATTLTAVAVAVGLLAVVYLVSTARTVIHV